MSEAAEIRAGKAFVEITAKDDKLQAGLMRAQRQLKTFARAIQSIPSTSKVVASLGASFDVISKKVAAAGSMVTGFGSKLLGLSALAAGGLGAAVKTFVDAGSAMDDMSQRTGIAVEALSALDYAAEQSGADLETLEGGLRTMQRTIGEAAGGTKSAADALSSLGVSAAELQGLSPDKQFALLADRVAAIEDPAVRAAKAMDVFGRSGQKLLPLLSGGSAGLASMEAEAKSLGVIVSGEAASGAAKLGDELDKLWRITRSIGINFGAGILPVISDFVAIASKAATAAAEWVRENSGLFTSIVKAIPIVAAAGAGFIALGTGLTALGGILAAVGTAFSLLGAAVGVAMTPMGLLAITAGGLAYNFGMLDDTIDGVKKSLASGFTTVAKDVSTAIGGISAAIEGGDIAGAWNVLWKLIQLETTRSIDVVMNSVWAFVNEIREAFSNAMYEFRKLNMILEHASTTSLFEAMDLTIDTVDENEFRKDPNWKNRRVGEEYVPTTLKQKLSFAKHLQDRARSDIRSEENGGHNRRVAEIERLEGELATESDAQKVKQFEHEAQAELEKLWDQAYEAQKQTAEKLKQPLIESGLLPRDEHDDRQAEWERRMGMESDFISQLEKRFSVKGTFNANAVRGLGVGNDPAERTAKNTERTARAAEKIAKASQSNGIVFV